ncbi:MAG: glycosyltransferase family 2 protein [Polyangiaceae bacterium]|nr:glycosyltransferase family 2 protein [Polyangiaceae bacterium]
MSRPHTNICLNMIVKNEAAVLPRLFRSVKDYIDYYVIVDTGSTDDTIALVKREMSSYGIEGEVYEREWINFGANRQQALELALQADKSDWLLFIDADEELGVSDPRFYEKLEPGVSYELEKHHSGVRYAVPHLANVRATVWRWEGPVHNYLERVEGSKERRLLKDAWIIYHAGEGAKSHGVTSEQKFLRDANLLLQYLKEHPNSARSHFYLGQSYKDAGHFEEAYEAYTKRTTMKGWVEEDFMAQLEAGRMAVRIGKPEEVVLRELLAAFEMRPTRVEPLYELARYFRLQKMHGKAFAFGLAGIQISRPNDSLFVAQDVYDWRLLDELGVAAYWVAEYAACKAACEAVLQRVEGGLEVPEADVRRVRKNLAFCENKLARK